MATGRQWQIHAGQTWRDPDTGDTIHVDEVWASDPFQNGEWRAMVRYTVSDGRESDWTTAQEFGGWIHKYGFTLEQTQEAAHGNG